MDSVTFKAPDYQLDGSFISSEYTFEGDESSGWIISRNGNRVLGLGAGYVLVKTLHCGVCSTDLARRFLPYPLPQVIGHEVVGTWNDKTVVSEINASHLARNLEADMCAPCSSGMESHCPERITLGIDRLPGGFSPYFLAPVNGLKEIPATLPSETAAIVEPLAAALQAVHRTPPREGDKVAVIGPRRLGALIIASLAGYRKKQNTAFSISALVRHHKLKDLCSNLGADDVVIVDSQNLGSLSRQFDVVYDTTGTTEGFMMALELAKRVVHLKSTNGQSVAGLDYLTEMVVDEIGLLPYSSGNLLFSWLNKVQSGEVRNILVSSDLSDEMADEIAMLRPEATITRCSVFDDREALLEAVTGRHQTGFTRFDVAVVAGLQEVNAVIRPIPEYGISLVRPRGNVLLGADATVSGNRLFDALTKRQLEIHTSRCGSFPAALQLLEDNSSLLTVLRNDFITHRFSLDQIDQAFEIASDSSQSIKVVVSI